VIDKRTEGLAAAGYFSAKYCWEWHGEEGLFKSMGESVGRVWAYKVATLKMTMRKQLSATTRAICKKYATRYSTTTTYLDTHSRLLHSLLSARMKGDVSDNMAKE
jgi:hypothetical protein